MAKKELTDLEKRLISSLCKMYDQYCDGLAGFDGHKCMQAGESAEDILLTEFDLFTDHKLDEKKVINLIGEEYV